MSAVWFCSCRGFFSFFSLLEVAEDSEEFFYTTHSISAQVLLLPLHWSNMFADNGWISYIGFSVSQKADRSTGLDYTHTAILLNPTQTGCRQKLGGFFYQHQLCSKFKLDIILLLKILITILSYNCTLNFLVWLGQVCIRSTATWRFSDRFKQFIY